jgi:hypothetical protein
VDIVVVSTAAVDFGAKAHHSMNNVLSRYPLWLRRHYRKIIGVGLKTVLRGSPLNQTPFAERHAKILQRRQTEI